MGIPLPGRLFEPGVPWVGSGSSPPTADGASLEHPEASGQPPFSQIQSDGKNEMELDCKHIQSVKQKWS